MTQVPLTTSATTRPLPDALAGLAEQFRGEDLVVLGNPGGIAHGRWRRFHWSLRERFQATTNVGLTPPAPALGAEAPQRHALSGRGGLPSLSYLAAGDPEGRRVLFIHGTPGEAADWTPFLGAVPPFQQRLAVDRPGFGQSGPGGPVAALPEQSRAIAALLEAGPAPAILVGSSYGGPVALQLAADRPDLVSGIVLVGSAADPEHEKTHPLQRLAAVPSLSRLLPRALHHSNTELLALRRGLEELGDRLHRIRVPVTILQGVHDTLVPPANAGYLTGRLTGTIRRRVMLVDRAGHFLHILRPGLVEDALSDMVAAHPA